MAKNPAVVLRLPWHKHLKNPEKPFDVKCLYIDPQIKYTEDQMTKAFGEFFEEEEKIIKSKRKKSIREEIKGWNHKEMLLHASWTSIVDNETITFKSNSKWEQIYSKWESTSSWIDEKWLIGSHDGWGPYRYNYLLWYKGTTEADILDWIDENFSDKLKNNFESYNHKIPKKWEITPEMCIKIDNDWNHRGLYYDKCMLFCLQELKIWVTDEGYRYMYTDWIRTPIQKTELSNKIKKILTKNLNFKNWNSNIFNEIIRLIDMEAYNKKLTEALTKNVEYDLCLADCIIDIRTEEKRPYKQQEYKFYKLKYDSSLLTDNTISEPQYLLTFLNDTLSHYNDTKGIINILSRYFGYCLIPRSGLEKSLLLLGASSQGKSTFMNVIKNIVWLNNTSYQKIWQLAEDKFSRVKLIGKLINIDGDLDIKVNFDEGIIKQILEWDTISAEYKYQTSFDMKINTKFLLGSNHTKYIWLEKSTVQRRLMMIVFNRKSQTDKYNLLENILNEDKEVFKRAYNWLREIIKSWKSIRPLEHPELNFSNMNKKHNTFIGLDECIKRIHENLYEKKKITKKDIELVTDKYPGVTYQDVKKILKNRDNINYKRTSKWFVFTETTSPKT